jgi:hypothetical protein
MAFKLDSPVRFSCTFTGATPTTVTLVLQDPAKTVTRYVGALGTPPVAGTYEVVKVLDQPGGWTRKWHGIGATALDVWHTDEKTIMVEGSVELR